MERQPLQPGSVITLANGGTYIIDHLISRGGFSLIYAVHTLGESSSLVLKEFFPAIGAFRDSHGKVCPTVDNEEGFRRQMELFQSEGAIGGRVADASFQAVAFLQCCDGYAIMKQESADMCSIAELVAGWDSCPPMPLSDNAGDIDPCFIDLPRLSYALRVVDSVLDSVSPVHEQGYLHLDISRHNALWATQNRRTGRGGTALLADFGCAATLDGGTYRPQRPLSYSPGFAAPELHDPAATLTPATDLYAVGMLLFYLCVGEAALETTRNRRRHIQRETAPLDIPSRMKEQLVNLLSKATADQPLRYADTHAMQKDIRQLYDIIPLHPINPDNTRAFTLYSLKAMLEGSPGSRYSWAHELQDRRQDKAIEVTIPDTVHGGLSSHVFADDEDFLRFVLPHEIFAALKKHIDAQPNRAKAVTAILTGRCDHACKKELRSLFSLYKGRRWVQIGRTLLDNEAQFYRDASLLFDLLGEEGQYLRSCYQRCHAQNYACVGLALFAVFALLGPEEFHVLVSSPQDAPLLFPID